MIRVTSPQLLHPELEEIDFRKKVAMLLGRSLAPIPDSENS